MSASPDPTTAPAEGADAPAAKNAIFETAVRLFASQGYAATGVRQVAREAGVNLATINYFFGSKAGLLSAILDSFFGPFVEVMENNLQGGEAIEVRLRRTVKAIAVYIGEVPERMIITLTELPHDTPEIIDLKAAWQRRLVGVVKQHIFDHLDAETQSRIPLAVIAPALGSLVASHYLFRPLLEKSRPPGWSPDITETYPDLIAELFLNGFNGLREKALEAPDD